MRRYFNVVVLLINWLHEKLTQRQFLIFSSIIVGLTAGIAAVVLKLFVHYIHLALTYDYGIKYQYYLYLIFPSIGILLTVFFVKRHLKGKLGRGSANILYSIAKKSSILPKDQMYSHIVTSALTVGFGGSAGLESPIVTTGSAIGSNFAKTFKVDYKDRTLLLASGAAAGIAAAFNAPIAGMLFALEVLLVDVKISAFIPLMIASASGVILSNALMESDILLTFELRQPFDYHNVLYYVMLGVLAGMVSVYYSRLFLKAEHIIKSITVRPYLKALTGGLIIAMMVLIFPPLFGEGYESIKVLSDIQPEKLFEHSILSAFTEYKWMIFGLIVLTMFLKVVAAAITIGSGGNGGNFAPSMFVGAYLGFAFSSFVNMLGFSKISESNFTIVGMAGILTGVFHAPLTGIFLIAEITGGYELMIPLMIVSASSFTIVKYFEPYSMDTKKLVKKGHMLTHDKDKNILSNMKTTMMVETDLKIVSPEATLGQLVNVVANSKRNIFPVVNYDEKLVGIIKLDDIREVMFKHDLYDKIQVKELMSKPPAIILAGESMESVMKKFDETEAWNLPVVSGDKYLGFVSKSSIFTKYRERLIRDALT